MITPCTPIDAFYPMHMIPIDVDHSFIKYIQQRGRMNASYNPVYGIVNEPPLRAPTSTLDKRDKSIRNSTQNRKLDAGD